MIDDALPSAALHEARYGKSSVRLFLVYKRHSALQSGLHDVLEADVKCLLEGDFDASYKFGDNSNVIPTDTLKNTIYFVAKSREFNSIEQLADAISNLILQRHKHVARITLWLVENMWHRLGDSGLQGVVSDPHDHVFLANSYSRLCKIQTSRQATNLISGVQNVKLLKSTQSGFEGFLVDDLTTLKPARDRIFCTNMKARWSYGDISSDSREWVLSQLPQRNDEVLRCLVKEFAGPSRGGKYSESVQATLFRMAQLALREVEELTEIRITMPNIHYNEIDSTRWKNCGDGQVFVPTDAPSGYIEGRVRRVTNGMNEFVGQLEPSQRAVAKL